MALKSETNLKNRVLKRLKAMSKLWYVKTSERAQRGIPDLLICYAGVFIAIELKRSEKATVTALQLYNLDAIEKAGGYSFILHPNNIDEVIETLQNIHNNQVFSKVK